jgi:hypothetical protein
MSKKFRKPDNTGHIFSCGSDWIELNTYNPFKLGMHSLSSHIIHHSPLPTQPHSWVSEALHHCICPTLFILTKKETYFSYTCLIKVRKQKINLGQIFQEIMEKSIFAKVKKIGIVFNMQKMYHSVKHNLAGFIHLNHLSASKRLLVITFIPWFTALFSSSNHITSTSDCIITLPPLPLPPFASFYRLLLLY